MSATSRVVIAVVCLSVYGCFDEGEEEKGYLANGIWESSHEYVDDGDSLLSKFQIMIANNKDLDFQRRVYNQSPSGAYDQLFDFTRVLGSIWIENDSLILFSDTQQDTCCEVLDMVDIDALPKKKIPENLRRTSALIRNLDSTGFEIQTRDPNGVFWQRYEKN